MLTCPFSFATSWRIRTPQFNKMLQLAELRTPCVNLVSTSAVSLTVMYSHQK